MQKKLLGMLLALTLLVSLVTPALAADTADPSDVVARQDAAGLVSGGEEITVPGEGEATDPLTQQDAAGFLLLWAGMEPDQLGNYPYDWNAMAMSAAVVDEETFAPEDPCTYAEFSQMAENVMPLYDALHADKMEPLFINGMAQPIFPYTTGSVEEGYSNEDSDIIRYCVYVETDYDTDGDGKLDLVKALVQIPRAAAEGDYEAATIYEARPYITGCTDYSIPYGTDAFDIDDLYAQPAARVAEGTATTMEAAADADSSDWYYFNPFENMMDYEDLDWYDYYLVRGFAVVECGGLGTRGSEGFETCGSDLEIDAFKCVIEWLHGDRVAYTDKEHNIAIEADWSNGKVGMTGRSYAGTTQFGLATTGVEGLETIVPVAGIASWYEYTNSQGVSTRSNVAYTNSLAAYCAGRYLDSPEAEAAAEDWYGIEDYQRTDDYESIREDYSNYLGALQRQQQALNGDYGSQDESIDNNTWAIRDYTLNAEKIQCPALLVHGLNDYNVRTKEFELMYNAFVEAGQNVKILLHQDGHLTPTYPAGGLVFDIGDQTYDEILNKWFSHYLYGVENNAENMPAVTAQDSHNTDVWNSYDSWKAEDSMTFRPSEELDETTTISSNYSAAGITSWNWQSQFTSGSTDGSVMYTQPVEEDLIIKGSVAVNFSASTANETVEVTPYADSENNETPRGTAVDHDSMMEQAGAPVVMAMSANLLADETPLSERDALMVSAMLVDIAPEGETFQAFNTSGNYVPKTTIMEGGAWMGGGLKNFDLTKLDTSEVTYKIISRGWMDLCNPDAGFDSATASTRVSLEEGKSYDYTIYLQPTVYTIEEGHTLALVIYAYEPGMGSYSQNYEITVNNDSVNAVIPLSADPVALYTVEYAAENGTVESAVVSGDKVTAGSEVTMNAVADAGYYFVDWTVNGKTVSGDSTETFTIDADTVITANFARMSSGGSGSSSNKVTVSSTTNGTVNVSSRNPAVGAKVTVTVTPKEGYELDTLKITTKSGDAVSYTTEGNRFTFTYQEPVNISATFRASDDAADGLPFTDAANHWALEAITYAYDNGLMDGTSATAFTPDGTLTRAMTVTILWRAAGEPAAEAANPFADVAADSWYAAAVQWAYANGIVSGVSDTEFAPNSNITREQLAAMLYRYAQYQEYAVSADADALNSFTDASDVSAYAVEAMQWACGAGLINGRTDTTLIPAGTATRAEAATILMRFLENVAK